jgi:phosphoribosylanthranilate isomerase
MKPLFRIKICGITSVEDARAAAAAGADAIGLNFYPSSPRFVSRQTASAIRRESLPSVTCVGVFVNASIGEVCETVSETNLDAIQLHGDESPDYVAELKAAQGLNPLPMIQAFRCRQNDFEGVARRLQNTAALGVEISAALIDACVEGKYGGSGVAVDWRAARNAKPLLGNLPLVLAGGLNPENVEAAIIQVGPDAVDVASGVESQPGSKDHRAIERFVASARRGFEFLANRT